MLDIINIAASILLGMSIIGTCASILLFIIVKLFNISSLIKTTSRLCILFAITWILNIGCNVFVLLTTPASGIATVSKGISKNIKPGTIMLTKDQVVPQKNHIVAVNTKDANMEISLWDFAEEDGDSIQILFNGQPISNSVQLKNAPKTVSIPTKGTLQIKGVKNGVSSITYAIYIPKTKKTYFNSVSLDGTNVYTINNKK
jgi:hypothetical protein